MGFFRLSQKCQRQKQKQGVFLAVPGRSGKEFWLSLVGLVVGFLFNPQVNLLAGDLRRPHHGHF